MKVNNPILPFYFITDNEIKMEIFKRRKIGLISNFWEILFLPIFYSIQSKDRLFFSKKVSNPTLDPSFG